MANCFKKRIYLKILWIIGNDFQAMIFYKDVELIELEYLRAKHTGP